MFPSFSRLLTFLAVLFAAILVFARFHGAVFSLSGDAAHNWKVLNGQTIAAAGRNYDVNYNVNAAENTDPGHDGKPLLPDISAYTIDKIAALAPVYKPGKIFIRSLSGLGGMREFVKNDNRIQHLRLSQMKVDPDAIVLQEGHYDFAHLYEEVRALAGEGAIRKDGTVYTLRMPLYVDRHASLTIADGDVSELRLSQDKNAFIVNSGDLFILRTTVTGWNEKGNKPAFFQDKTIYRPFIATWSGSHLYIAGSRVASLGYRKGKSYGLTYSTCLYCLKDDPALPRPTGAVVGSTFTDMYYGFYSYEADDVAIVNNIYANNAVYGIDPHDRSRRLIIAGNEAYGSKKKHGIIISRNVDDSWIFNNYSHDNHGSGIMIDRVSRNNIIAHNTVARNEGDGITFFESQNNKTFGNKIYKNNLSGVRIRNSWDIDLTGDEITDNGRVPVVVYSMNLAKNQPLRNLKEDPYAQKAGATMRDSVIKLADQKPALKIDAIEKVVLSDIHVLSAGSTFAKNMFAEEADIDSGVDNADKEIVVRAHE